MFAAKMKFLTLLLVGFLAFWTVNIRADNLDEFGEQSAHFYLAPTQESFDAFQKRAEQLKPRLEASGNAADLLVAVTIARISQKHHWPIGDGALGEVAKEIVGGRSNLARYVSDDRQVDPTKLDIWWASFFATGEDRFLENIFQFAGKELPKGKVGGILVVGAATWSFKSNCRQHQRVFEFAKRKSVSPGIPADQRAFLKECIAYGQNISAEPNSPKDAQQSQNP